MPRDAEHDAEDDPEDVAHDHDHVIRILNDALEREMGAVVQLLHHSFLVFGPSRQPIQELLRRRVQDSLAHATTLGEKITALGGHPSIAIRTAHPPGEQSMREMLAEDLAMEEDVLSLYVDSLELVRQDVALEQVFRDIIVRRQRQVEDFEKLLRPERPPTSG